jgi:hypothetical protein
VVGDKAGTGGGFSVDEWGWSGDGESSGEEGRERGERVVTGRRIFPIINFSCLYKLLESFRIQDIRLLMKKYSINHMSSKKLPLSIGEKSAVKNKILFLENISF